MKNRYILDPPVPNGEAWWDIADTESEIEPNFEVASFSIHMPNAEQEARSLCDRLNGSPYRYMPASDITGQTYHPPDPA